MGERRTGIVLFLTRRGYVREIRRNEAQLTLGPGAIQISRSVPSELKDAAWASTIAAVMTFLSS